MCFRLERSSFLVSRPYTESVFHHRPLQGISVFFVQNFFVPVLHRAYPGWFPYQGLPMLPTLNAFTVRPVAPSLASSPVPLLSGPFPSSLRDTMASFALFIYKRAIHFPTFFFYLSVKWMRSEIKSFQIPLKKLCSPSSAHALSFLHQ